ncbi:hypothetical protein L211DRAFT_870440 [Terfezia boudieri ATCC MYA-4762]|uniref:Uncharacterized protein n=1 Tax=Terfezia boudieri ATCC MYA-4762 TaxID=1051890 RepID=A0A3N4LDB7_9PEZI|nr:hypothetical protein L211DRAFT_870440 [Terfezia boudieri ATCC MYA-4762]
MSTSATPIPKPHKSSLNTPNPFGSPLRRRPIASVGFAFDLESLQQHKGASPVKTPGAISSPNKQKSTVEGKTKMLMKDKPVNAPLRMKHGNVSRKREGGREEGWEWDIQTPSRPQLQRKEKSQASSSSMNMFGPTKTLRRTPPPQSQSQPQTNEPSPTPVRSFGKLRSPNILSPPPKAASIKSVDLDHREDVQDDLVAALLERKRVLEGECHAVKRKCDELELSKKEAEERKKKNKLAFSSVDGDVPGGELDILIQSLLAANDSNLTVPKPPKVAAISISTTTTSTVQAEGDTDVIASARPLPPPSDPSHPLYRTLCPFTFTSHTITIVPSADYPPTDPPTTVTHHTLCGHTPHHLLSFRFEFEVARATVAGKSSSTIIDLPTTAVSSHAQPELRNIFAVARARRDLLLAMTALAEFTRLATIRAEGWRVIARAYKGIVSTPHRSRLWKGLESKRRRRRRRRLDLLSYIGKREMWFRNSREAEKGQEQGQEEMCLNWEIEFERTTGMGWCKVGVEVVLPGSSSGAGGGSRRGKKMGGEVAMVGGLKGEVEKVFLELVRVRGIVGGVRAIVEVVFGVEGVWEEEQEEELEEGEEEEEE